MTVGFEWSGVPDLPPIIRRTLEPRFTRAAQAEYAEMQNGQEARFCRDCDRLAYCPQCGTDLRGKTVCHVAMSTHYREQECNFNANWMTDYQRKESK